MTHSVQPPRPGAAPSSSLPESTYRLQFHAGFTFRHAAEVVPYLASLGVTHVYASPILKARPGSMHGYDVIDHCALNPELGTPADFDDLADALRRHGMSLILDVVPNHVGVATNDNAWWNDVLEHGPASRYAGYFDITWSGSPRPELHGRVLLPVLGKPYGEALEAGELRLSFHSDRGAFFIAYHESRFPVSPRSYPQVLPQEGFTGEAAAEMRKIVEACQALPDRCDADEAERRAQAAASIKESLRDLCRRHPAVRRGIDEAVLHLNGRAGEPSSFDGLDALLAQQCYRLAHWRTASDEINYRRFFDINDLAALAMERPEVFDATHRLVFDLIAAGKVAGLRIDHPDGLFDPAGYFKRLQDRFAEIGGQGPLYVAVEKILAADEALPASWPVQGTTGYDFLNQVNGLYVAPDAAAAFDRFYHDWTGDPTSYDDLVYRNKHLILERSLASELRMLAHDFDRLAQRHRHSRDFTHGALTAALREVIACFPVYRTYVGERWATRDADRAHVDAAVRQAAARNPRLDPAVLRFVRDTLLLEFGGDSADEDLRSAQRRVAGKFQQLTAPVTAKGIEDTTFWVYNRLLSLNEVGGEPSRFGVSPEALHEYFADRQRNWPYAMSALSTHDTKRSEDVRARLNVLSEMPEDWPRLVARWSDLNASHRTSIAGSAVPDRNLEYSIYQRLIGVWPMDLADGGAIPADFVTRVHACTVKALRESKLYSSWTDPDEPLESAVLRFVDAILDARRGRAFRESFLPFQRRVAHYGTLNSLSQTLVKLTAPGVPDTYQGTETWNFSLVDPDNRRPVDYSLLRAALARAEQATGSAPATGDLKQFLHARVLRERRDRPGLFTGGEYLPLRARGERARHVFAFARRQGRTTAVTIVPRFLVRGGLREGEWPTGKAFWGDTTLDVPAGDGGALRCALSGGPVRPGHEGGVLTIGVADALRTLPVALLLSGVRG